MDIFLLSIYICNYSVESKKSLWQVIDRVVLIESIEIRKSSSNKEAMYFWYIIVIRK